MVYLRKEEGCGFVDGLMGRRMFSLFFGIIFVSFAFGVHHCGFLLLPPE